MKALIIFFIFMSAVFAQENYKFISAGESHTCVATDSEVICWGGNSAGQGQTTKGFKNIRKLVSYSSTNCVLDDEGTWCWGEEKDGKQAVANLTGLDDVGMGYFHSCALLNGKPKCFGSTSAYNLLKIPTDIENAHSLVTGTSFSCVMVGDQVRCWGDNKAGVAPTNLGPVIKIVGKGYSVCALKKDHSVRCWGALEVLNSLALTDVEDLTLSERTLCAMTSLGLNCWGGDAKPVEHPELKPSEVKVLTSGANHTCALKTKGHVCWGNNYFGQVTNFPPLLKNVTDVFASEGSTCFMAEGKVTCLGIQTNAYNFGSGMDKITDISTKAFLRCIIDQKKISCEGGGGYGQTYIPRDISNPTKISVGKYFVCALAEPLGVRCWGNGSVGQCNPPYGVHHPYSLSAGDDHACVVSDDGVECWGGNNLGQTNVPALESPGVKVVSGANFNCLLTESKDIKCWGENKLGQTEVPTFDFDPMDILAGDQFVCAYDQNNIKCWGDNSLNQLLVPSKVKNIRKVSVGAVHGCLLDDYGVQCWGSNTAGQYTFRQ